MIEKNRKIYSALVLASLMLLPLSITPITLIYAAGEQWREQERERHMVIYAKHGANFNISTDIFTVSFSGSQQVPKFQFWYTGLDENRTVYQVFFHQVFEFNDTDGDGVYNATKGEKMEQMFALPSADLSLSDPKKNIEGGKVIGVQFNFTMLGRKGDPLSDVNMTLRCSLYNETQTILVAGGNKYNVTGSAELKIDIIINRWPWKDSDNKLCLWWSVNQQRDTTGPSVTHNRVNFGRGYFSWISSATVYNETYTGTVDVNASFSMQGNKVNIFMCYPNFKDKSLTHDPSLGVKLTHLQVSGSLSRFATTVGEDVTASAVVKDAEGNLVRGATVKAIVADTTTTLSDQGNGNYQGTIKTSDLKAGTYNILITAQKDGYTESQYSTALSVETAVPWVLYGTIATIGAAVAITTAIMVLRRKH